MTISEVHIVAEWSTVTRTVTRTEQLLPVVIDDDVIHLGSLKVSPT